MLRPIEASNLFVGESNEMKVARSIWKHGKGKENIKELPMPILHS